MFRIYKVPLLFLMVTTVFVGCEPEPRDISTLTVLDDGVGNGFLIGTALGPEDREPYSGPVFSPGGVEMDTQTRSSYSGCPGPTGNNIFYDPCTPSVNNNSYSTRRYNPSWNGHLKDGLLSGPYEAYYENGQLHQKATYANGERDGPYEAYRENGQLMRKGSHSKGELDGPYEEYYENGQLEAEVSYSEGEMDGSFAQYYENGQLMRKGSHSKGELDGPVDEYDASGKRVTSVVVRMEIHIDKPDGDGVITRALSDIEIQLLPYDRDAVFDSMTTAFGRSEPPVPAELVAARDEVRAAQEEWQVLQNRWSTIRDTLMKLNTAMEQYNRGEARYVALFREWGGFDAELSGVEREMERSFDRFNELQQGTIRASDSIRVLQHNWADEAFAGIGEVFTLKTRASGLAVVVDTTDASGIARTHFQGIKLGTYWVHARYELDYTELYWNFQIEVAKGGPQEIRLTRANAQERMKM